MTTTITRKVLSHFLCDSIKKSRSGIIAIKCNGTVAQTAEASSSANCDIPKPEPNKIQTAVLNQFDVPLSIVNSEPPTSLEEHEVLIDVRYCAINPTDILLSKNLYAHRPKLPMVLGYELVGNIIKTGGEAEKKGYKVGDKVVALNKDRYGGLAERCVAEVNDIWKVPSSIKSLDAVCILDNYITALMALERKVTLEEDEMILINVGLSDIGLAAVDIATNVFRSNVIGVCATEGMASLVRDKGAFAALKFSDKQLQKSIEKIAAEKDIKKIFEGESGDFFKKILKTFTNIYTKDLRIKEMLRDDNFAVVVEHLSREGRLVVAGAAETEPKEGDKENGYFKVTGFNLREYRKKKPEMYRQAGDEVLQFFEEGLIKPRYTALTGFYKINKALEYASDPNTTGKVIIDIKNKEAETEIKK